MGLDEALAGYLERNHAGSRNAVTSRELEMRFTVTGSEIREAINTLRRQGVPIASGATGYWYAVDDRDIRATIHNMENRIKGITAAVIGLKRSIKEDTSC